MFIETFHSPITKFYYVFQLRLAISMFPFPSFPVLTPTLPSLTTSTDQPPPLPNLLPSPQLPIIQLHNIPPLPSQASPAALQSPPLPSLLQAPQPPIFQSHNFPPLPNQVCPLPLPTLPSPLLGALPSQNTFPNIANLDRPALQQCPLPVKPPFNLGSPSQISSLRQTPTTPSFYFLFFPLQPS